MIVNLKTKDGKRRPHKKVRRYREHAIRARATRAHNVDAPHGIQACYAIW